MILGHLPAGYVAAKLLHKRFAASVVSWKPFLAVALLGSVAPDFDHAYYLIDSSRHHHAFFTHFPAFWGGLLATAAIWYRLARNKAWATLALVFTLNACIHLCLDSIAGSIRWLAPFDFSPYSLTSVPRVTGSRRLDYLMHWAAWLELVPIVWASFLWKRSSPDNVSKSGRLPRILLTPAQENQGRQSNIACDTSTLTPNFPELEEKPPHCLTLSRNKD